MLLNVTRQLVLATNHLTASGLNVGWGAVTQIRYKSKIYRKHYVKKPDPFPDVKYEAAAMSLKTKGYNRSQSSYEPPKNVAQTVDKLKAGAKLTTGSSGKKFNLEEKFSFLLLCSQEFNHTVPNSLLHEIETIDDVIQFYKTPINTFLPLDELLTRELPPNLHIEQKYNRYHPDTDTMFNGKTAFPGSSTIVTGITTRKRYSGHKSELKLGIDKDPL